jgi:HemY protein
MIRVILFLGAILAAAAGLSWLADRPGSLTLTWEGYEIETTVFRAVVIAAFLLGLAAFVWSLVTQLWNSPATVGSLLNRRRQKRGLEAISSGMIAIGAGDRSNATRYAIQARKTLPNEPLTHLLRAQAAQLSGDKATSRRIFEAMLGSPDTEQLGLRGLFLEAQREKETEAARQFAERALQLNPKLGWANEALFDIQCHASDWAGALDTLASARRNNLIEKPLADRRRAVLLTGQAIAAEEADPNAALNLAVEAHALAPDLVPASALAGRMLVSRGNTPRAAKIIQKTWSRSPHPDLATVYAFARVGDSPRDRLDRVKQLAALLPRSPESAIAVANAAIDAREFNDARSALEPMLAENLTQRIATLMARLESEQHGDKGRVREWLARAVNAPRDPVWTADGLVSDHCSPVSPVTGTLDAFQWRVPVEQAQSSDTDMLSRKIEELVGLGAAPAIEARASVRDDEDDAPELPVKPAPRRAADVSDADVVEDAPAPVVVAVQPTPRPAPAPEAPAAVKPAAHPTQAPPKTPSPAKTAELAVRPLARDTVAVAPSQAVAPTPVTAKPAASKGGVDSKVKEPRIFVAPHAPDDPGPEGPDADPAVEPGARLRPPYRAAP